MPAASDIQSAGQRLNAQGHLTPYVRRYAPFDDPPAARTASEISAAAANPLRLAREWPLASFTASPTGQ